MLTMQAELSPLERLAADTAAGRKATAQCRYLCGCLPPNTAFTGAVVQRRACCMTETLILSNSAQANHEAGAVHQIDVALSQCVYRHRLKQHTANLLGTTHVRRRRPHYFRFRSSVLHDFICMPWLNANAPSRCALYRHNANVMQPTSLPKTHKHGKKMDPRAMSQGAADATQHAESNCFVNSIEVCHAVQSSARSTRFSSLEISYYKVVEPCARPS